MQASPRVDVDEAPYGSNAPGTDLLYVTELEDAHDSIELLKSDDNLEFFCTKTLADIRLQGPQTCERFQVSFLASQICPNASSVGSLIHATLPICVRRSVVCIPNMSTFHAFPSLWDLIAVKSSTRSAEHSFGNCCDQLKKP